MATEPQFDWVACTDLTCPEPGVHQHRRARPDEPQSISARLHPCANPACPRKTTATYCCGPCDVAHQGHYDPDSYHSPGCDERAVSRGTR